jgi:hypothetical protein
MFMDNVMKNPLKSAREELHLFLESGKMPLTPDGHFLAFKRVNNNLKSMYDNATQHAVGTWTEMPREKVDPDRHNTCSNGLHFCSPGYLPSYNGHRGVIIVVKINPADVVAIPSDYSNQKGRTWKYHTLCILKDQSEVNDFSFSKAVLGVYKGVDTFEAPELDEPISETVFEVEEALQKSAVKIQVNPKKPYHDMTARQFLKAVKREGGARPYARENELAKSTVQDWVKRARAEVGM